MKSIAGYNVIKLLAKGGMAAIYLAEQKSLERQVVLKFLNPKLSEKIRNRFIEEGRIIASLKHPNIITVFDVVSTGKYDFLAMEFLPDGDLESRLTTNVDIYFSLNIISKISEALHLIHKQGIIHGDLKPANILFRGKDCPLVTDFGISHRIEPKKEVDLSLDDLYASPSYASPELIQGKPFDYRTDMYSLGIMMYEMLVGKKPFVGENDLETIANSIQQPIPKLPQSLNELQPLLNSLLAKSPDDRLSDAKLVARFIKQYINEHPHLNNVSSETKLIDTDVVVEYIARKQSQKRINNMKYSIIGAFVLFTVGLLSFYLTQNRSPENKVKLVVKSESIATPDKSANKEKTEAAFDISQVIQEIEKNNALKILKHTEQVFLEQQKQLEQSLLLEQEAALEKKNKEIAKVKQELAHQKKSLIENKKRNIRHFLEKGKSSLKKYKLTTPLNDNALYYFQKVLELDKNNEDAKQGIKDVVHSYELLAIAEIEKYKYQKAQYYISAGLSVDADNERLLELQKTANLSNEPVRVINRVKDFFKNM